MWRVLVYLILIGVAAFGAVWLADTPERISVTWAGREYTISLAVGVVALVGSAILLALALGAVQGILTLPVRLREKARRRRESKGHTALSRGIVAVGAGDLATARRHAAEAERLLGHQPLALLLKAQAAQASGDRDAAEATFRAMADVKETRVLGLRGLYLEARRRDDPVAAREYATEAAGLAPAVAWANDAVLEGLSAEGDWAGAIRTVERRTSLGLVDRATSRRQRAVLLTADALAREPHDPEGSLAAAEKAVKLAPGLVPAATLAGRLLSRKGDLKRAARIIETAWAESPHPDLAGAYLNLRPGDSALDRLRRAETLARLSSWSDEARYAIARAAIEARELDRARETLRPVLDESGPPTVRTCLTMAEIEGRSGQSGAAREWLARASRAPRDKMWIADGIVSDHWEPVSPATGRLDAFQWETPPDLLAAPVAPDLASFEPDSGSEEELPAFLGRQPALAPPAPAKNDTGDAEPASAAPSMAGAAPVKAGPPVAVMPSEPVPAPVKPDPVVEEAAPFPVLPHPLADPARYRAPPAAPVQPALPVAAASSAPAGPAPLPAASKTRSLAEAEPVVFPVSRPPDDPGLDGDADQRQRFRLRV